jgi:hypothetical protein
MVVVFVGVLVEAKYKCTKFLVYRRRMYSYAHGRTHTRMTPR